MAEPLANFFMSIKFSETFGFRQAKEIFEAQKFVEIKKNFLDLILSQNPSKYYNNIELSIIICNTYNCNTIAI